MTIPEAPSYPDEASACAAFANAKNSGDTEAFLNSLAPDVRLISKWRNADGWRAVTVWLWDVFSAGREGEVTLSGVIDKGRLGGIPCAYTLENPQRPALLLTFNLTEQGRIDVILQHPGHYYEIRDGVLFDVLSEQD